MGSCECSAGHHFPVPQEQEGPVRDRDGQINLRACMQQRRGRQITRQRERNKIRMMLPVWFKSKWLVSQNNETEVLT